MDARPEAVATDDRFLTEKEVAARLSITLGALQMWRFRKTGPRYVKLSSMVRYRASDVEKWIAERFVDPSDVSEVADQ